MNKPTRIKYTLKDGVYTSNQKFLGNDGTLLHVVIQPDLSTVTVVNDSTPVEVLTYTSFTRAKVEAKKLLQKYGVTFFEEVRRKKEPLTQE